MLDIDHEKFRSRLYEAAQTTKQAAIAEKLGIDKGNLSSYLNGKKDVTVTFIGELHKAFPDFSIDYLFGWTDENNINLDRGLTYSTSLSVLFELYLKGAITIDDSGAININNPILNYLLVSVIEKHKLALDENIKAFSQYDFDKLFRSIKEDYPYRIFEGENGSLTNAIDYHINNLGESPDEAYRLAAHSHAQRKISDKTWEDIKHYVWEHDGEGMPYDMLKYQEQKHTQEVMDVKKDSPKK